MQWMKLDCLCCCCIFLSKIWRNTRSDWHVEPINLGKHSNKIPWQIEAEMSWLSLWITCMWLHENGSLGFKIKLISLCKYLRLSKLPCTMLFPGNHNSRLFKRKLKLTLSNLKHLKDKVDSNFSISCIWFKILAGVWGCFYLDSCFCITLGEVSKAYFCSSWTPYTFC